MKYNINFTVDTDENKIYLESNVLKSMEIDSVSENYETIESNIDFIIQFSIPVLAEIGKIELERVDKK